MLDVPDASDESNAMKSGLGNLSLEACSVSFEHLKNPWKKPGFRKFQGIKESVWNVQELSDNKIVYTALDVTMPIVVVYYYLVHWASLYRPNGVSRGAWKVSWDTLLDQAVGPVMDRVIDNSLMSR